MKRRITLCAALLASALYAFSSAARAQSSPSPYTTGYRYDLMGRNVGTILPAPGGSAPLSYIAVRNSYDGSGFLVKVEKGYLSGWLGEGVAPAQWTGFTVMQTATYTYNSLGWKLSEQVVGSDHSVYAFAQYSHDAHGRVQCTTIRMNPATFGSEPGACALGTQGSQGADRITQDVYDAAGQLKQVQKAVGTSIQENYATYSYGQDGERTDVTDANGNHTQMAYDGFDRLIAWIFPSATSAGAVSSCTDTPVSTTGGISGPPTGRGNGDNCEKYQYDNNGNRATLAKRDGSVVSYGFDGLNRVSSKAVTSANSSLPSTDRRAVYYTYDALGDHLTAWFDSTTSSTGVTNTYDGFGRMTSTNLTMDGYSHAVSYQYDGDGNRVRVTFPDGNYATYGFDGLDRTASISRSGTSTVASYGYDAAGRRISFTGGIATSYGYDPLSRLNTLNNNPNANAAYNNQYAFSYNPASQIITRSLSNSAFADTGAAAASQTYATNGLNQYTSVAGGSFTYDLNGNLTSDGSSTYLYDVENRLVSASGAHGAALRYDPLGRLYEVVNTSTGATTRFAYGGDKLMVEYDQSGNVLRRYLHGADVKVDDPIAWYEGASFLSTNERFVRTNWQGSVVLVTDNAGQTIYGIDSYDEYGIPGAANVGRFQYTGQAWISEIAMDYYKARMYSPTLGRFLQSDPIGYKDDLDLYTYTGNDPLNGTDPDGREIRLQSHPVAFGKNHSKIVIVPANQSKYSNDTRFNNKLPDGRVYATIGAGPSGIIPGALGHLVEGVNRTKDVDQSSNKTDEVLQLPEGMSEDQAIQALFADSGAYPNDLTYALFPGSGSNEYNSNGFANGLLGAVGFKGYKQPPNTPGFNKPLPPSEFTPKGTVTVGPLCPESGCPK